MPSILSRQALACHFPCLRGSEMDLRRSESVGRLAHHLPQSFIGMVWHQQLLADAVGLVVGAVAGAGAGSSERAERGQANSEW
jgi:hypothetical protein